MAIPALPSSVPLWHVHTRFDDVTEVPTPVARRARAA
jgi:hypothetical protein